jgi:uncharacterized membrane protein
VTRLLGALALGAYLLLLALSVLWEGWLAPAPYAPPGFWLTLKAGPLLFPLFGLLRGRPYTYVWTGLLLLPYFMEGVVLAYLRAGDGFSRTSVLSYAWLEIFLCLAFFGCGAFYARRRAAENNHRLSNSAR